MGRSKHGRSYREDIMCYGLCCLVFLTFVRQDVMLNLFMASSSTVTLFAVLWLLASADLLWEKSTAGLRLLDGAGLVWEKNIVGWMQRTECVGVFHVASVWLCLSPVFSPTILHLFVSIPVLSANRIKMKPLLKICKGRVGGGSYTSLEKKFFFTFQYFRFVQIFSTIRSFQS